MGELAHAMAQCSQGLHSASVVVHRTVQPYAAARLPAANAVPAHQVVHDFTLLDGLQNFFWRTSCNIALSSDKSATSRLSLMFSSRNCLSSRASEGSMAP